MRIRVTAALALPALALLAAGCSATTAAPPGPGASGAAGTLRPAVIDTLIKAGETIQGSAQRLAVYQQMLQALATDVPYVPLYIQDYNVALSSKFAWPGYNIYTQWGDWELNLKPKN